MECELSLYLKPELSSRIDKPSIDVDVLMQSWEHVLFCNNSVLFQVVAFVAFSSSTYMYVSSNLCMY